MLWNHAMSSDWETKQFWEGSVVAVDILILLAMVFWGMNLYINGMWHWGVVLVHCILLSYG